LIEKYGITPAAEVQDDKTGPYCREDYCNIPWGFHVGDDNIGVKVFVALKNDTVTEIEIFFNSIFWNDIWSILVKKYDPAWDIERGTIGVMEYQTKRSINLNMSSPRISAEAEILAPMTLAV